MWAPHVSYSPDLIHHGRYFLQPSIIKGEIRAKAAKRNERIPQKKKERHIQQGKKSRHKKQKKTQRQGRLTQRSVEEENVEKKPECEQLQIKEA